MKTMLTPLAVYLAVAAPLSAAVFPVTTLADSGSGSLRAALLAANAAAGPDEVTFIGVLPLLGPLQSNGGPTPTHALAAASPARDAGDATGAPATDQRGVSRPQGAHVDIGAFELARADLPLKLSIAAASPSFSSSGVQLTIEGLAGESYVIEAASDLNGSWEVIGTAASTTGTTQYPDSSATGVPRRFYKARVVAP